jgi:hypothetical protein
MMWTKDANLCFSIFSTPSQYFEMVRTYRLLQCMIEENIIWKKRH